LVSHGDLALYISFTQARSVHTNIVRGVTQRRELSPESVGTRLPETRLYDVGETDFRVMCQNIKTGRGGFCEAAGTVTKGATSQAGWEQA